MWDAMRARKEGDSTEVIFSSARAYTRFITRIEIADIQGSRQALARKQGSSKLFSAIIIYNGIRAYRQFDNFSGTCSPGFFYKNVC